MSAANMTDVERKLSRIIADVLHCDPALLTQTAHMGTIPGWDSLTNLKVIVAVEAQFNIEATPRMLAEMTSVDGILSVLNRLGVT